MAWLTSDQILRTPTETLGIQILHRLQRLTSDQWGMQNFTTHYLAETMPPHGLGMRQYSADDLRAGRENVAAKITEAWVWLEQQRYLVPVGRPGEQWRQLTQRGQEVLKVPPDDALKRIRAGELLGPDLHPRIERLVRSEWNAGDFGTAIFKAAREVEIAVAEMLPQSAPGDKRLYGVDVINAAFGKGKPLADPGQDPGEQEGARALFAGFIGTFKNPGSHRHFEPDDPAQAAGIIRTADVLMRMLDDIRRQAASSP